MARKVALVGIGKIARDQHIPAINASPDWELAAAVSRSASVDGVANYTDIANMLAHEPDVEVVSLCVPPGPRFEMAKQAIAAGRHLMLEKPPGATISEVHQLRDLAEQAGVVIYATWHSREAEYVADAKAWLADKRVETFEIVWTESVRKWHPGQDWVFEPAGMGVFDPGINALSILTEIMPVPVRVTSAVLEFPSNRKTAIAAQMSFAGTAQNGSTATFDWRNEEGENWRIRVVTDQGTLELNDGGARLSINGQTQTASGDSALRGEYPNLYARMTSLLNKGRSDVDLRPLQLIADAYLLGDHKIIEPFDW